MAGPGRTTWTGFLKLSLVTAAVRLAPATSESERIRFHQLNKATGNRVKQQLVDSETGEVVERSEIIKGYEYSKGRYIEVTPDELESVKLETNHTITIDRFIDASEVNEIYRNTPYYVIPDGTASDEAYIVIREAMARAKKAAVGRVTIAAREHPVLIEPCGKGMALTTLRPEREVRHAKAYFEDVPEIDIAPDLMDMAETLIKSRQGHFEPRTFEDRYQEALRELVEAQLKGVPVEEAKEERAPNVVSIMDALKRSLAAEGTGQPAPAKKREAAEAKPKRAAAKQPEKPKPSEKKAATGGRGRRS